MFRIQLEKLRFLIEEMRIAFHLATLLDDPFVARMIARHILVRAENFIAHARRLRRPLADAGISIQDFHRTKEAYAKEFVEYFVIARHRLGAHVQDIDFGRRIELWHDIEISKISYFVDGALEIYERLKPLAIPGYVPYSEPALLQDESLREGLLQLKRSYADSNWVEIGADPLALTRGNTSALLNTTPIHQRAGQLALIRRWISIQRKLLDKFGAMPEISRILRARLITDIVSFCDCLVTRPVTTGALQAMDGLDRLLAAEAQSVAAISSFVQVSNFENKLQYLRQLRDKIGGHLEIADDETVGSLSAKLDSTNLEDVFRFYERVEAVFLKTCTGVIFLTTYAADGQRLHGLVAGRATVVPFSGDVGVHNATPAPPQTPSINEEEAYKRNLTLWLDGDADQKASARKFFWDAFAGSRVLESVEEIERFGPAEKFSQHEFRLAHKFLLDIISKGLSDQDFASTVELIKSCGRGWPYPLAELLVRVGQNATPRRAMLISIALGTIQSSPHSSATKLLEAYSTANLWPIRLAARLARFKIFVHSEGLRRINPPRRAHLDYDSVLRSLTIEMADAERLIFDLACAANLVGPMNTFFKPFESNYIALQSKIRAQGIPFLRNDETGSIDIKIVTFDRLIQTHDYVGVSVHLAVNMDEDSSIRTALIRACCDNTIVAVRSNQASRHLAMSFILDKQFKFALEIAEGLASRNPDWIEIQVLVAQILGEIPGEEEKASRLTQHLRDDYKIDATNEALLRLVERTIEVRKATN